MFPDMTLVNGPGSGYDLVHDLMPLNVGLLYKKLEASDGLGLGHLPAMAACSKGQIGALNAESFCERVLSCANLVVHDGNTVVLSDDEVSKLTVLRMNRSFMEFMRANYNAECRQAFTTSVVDVKA